MTARLNFRNEAQASGDDVELQLGHRSVAVLAWQAQKWPHLAAFLPDARVISPLRVFSADMIAGWGMTPTGTAAAALAALLSRPLLRLEDGFLRSIGLGKGGTPPVSIVVDDRGIFYDARHTSRLERLIADSLTDVWADRGKQIRKQIVATGLSKYNTGARLSDARKRTGVRRIMLVDQVFGDRSIAGALADVNTFARMVATARQMRPGAQLMIRMHPDVAAGFRRGNLDRLAPDLPRISVEMTAADALAECDEVWTVSSQLGFEALMHGLDVVTFGMPFYAGYGLTEDLASGPTSIAVRQRRTDSLGDFKGVTVDHLVAAAMTRYARYADPYTGHSLTVDEAIEWLLKRRSG